jgi:hypothetical protein
MIQANEMRIGSWVHDMPFDRAFQITAKHFANIESQTYRPIKLSPEILEKAGFKKMKGWGTPLYRYGDIIISQPLEDSFSFGYYREAGRRGTTATGFKYVHELQNLVFALTGTELTIEL